MRFPSCIAAVLALGGIVSANPLPIEPRQATGLNAAFKAKGRTYVGTSLTIRSDNSETTIIRNQAEFGSITPENAQKWDVTEPNRGSFSFGGADQVVNFATQNSKFLRCHTLVWHSQLPGWVSSINSNATLIQAMTTHIQTVMARYKGKCNHWDVVNEALNEDGTYRSSVFSRVIGEAFLPIAFRIAAAADPEAKLYYNDYNLEYNGPKTAGAARIVKLIQSWGVKIDGVGFQGHMVSEKTPTQDVATPAVDVLEKSLRTFTDLNVDVAYTEIDIRMNTPITTAKLQVQAAAYTRLTASCMNVPRCIGYTLWGVSDKYSWVPSTFSGEGGALLWNDSYQKKPAYQATLDAINAAPEAPAP